MQRFPPFDPPEYVSWKPDPALVKAYRATIEADSERAAVVTAKARSLPDLINSIDAGKGSNETCTCPPSRSARACGAPR